MLKFFISCFTLENRMDKLKKEGEKKKRKTMVKEKFKFIINEIISFVNSSNKQEKINDFLEINCLIFENEEENKHEYYEIFQNYIKLFEKELEIFLRDNFLKKEEVLESFIHFKDQIVYKDFLEEFMNINNFEHFKKTMVQKRIDLEKETLELLEKERKILEEEEAALNYAIELSKKAKYNEEENFKKISEINFDLRNKEKNKDEKIGKFIEQQNSLIKQIKRQTLKRLESKKKHLFIKKINEEYEKSMIFGENKKKEIKKCIFKEKKSLERNLSNIQSLKDLDLNQELKDLQKNFIIRREFKKEKLKKLKKKLKSKVKVKLVKLKKLKKKKTKIKKTKKTKTKKS